MIVCIWTWGYRPFICGGSVHYVLACEVECDGPHDLGRGYNGVTTVAPDGRVFVAEASSGAIVGSGATMEEALNEVRQDIKSGEKSVMKKQVAEALEHVKKAEVESRDFFWKAIGGQ